MYTLITIIVIVVVIGLVASWAMRGRSKRPESGPTIPDLSIAEEVQRVEQLHDEGKMTDAEYHEARSKLLS